MSTEQGRQLTLLSVVAPVFNEEAVLEAFYERVSSAMGDEMPWELVLVDDGSKDRSPEILARLAERDERVKVVVLSRNFGHQAALSAGLEHARGDCIATIDADLQDPPELIRDMIDHWRAGSDVVYAVRKQRAGEPRWRLTAIKWSYRLISKLAQLELPQNSGDFRVLDRRALDALLAMPERSRYLRGMTVWVGFTQTAFLYDRDARAAGETKYPLNKLIRLALDGIVSFSHTPLQLSMLAGFAFAAIAFLGIPVAIGFRIAGEFVPGVTTTIILVLLLGGIQLMAIGMIGEYLGRIYDEVKQRPLYLVRGVANLEPHETHNMPGTGDDARDGTRVG